MLDTNRVGIKIASLRKSAGYSQEKLAEMLCISPQAISRWENGHTLPETSLLPIIAQIFTCSIDEIIMPAYAFDEKIEAQKSDKLNFQAEQIAKQVIKKLEDHIMIKGNSGFCDDVVIEAVTKVQGFIGSCRVTREKPVRADGNTDTKITVITPHGEFKLLERFYGRNDTELRRYDFLRQYSVKTPRIYHIDFEKKAILLEDISDKNIQGYDYDENNENGEIIRGNYNILLKAVAELHSIFWNNYNAFAQLGPEWRLDSKENLVAHISAMEKDFRKYKKNEESGKIPKVWETCGKVFNNNLSPEMLDCFEEAIERLKNEYSPLINSRFQAGKNITVIHGDLHPGQIFISKSAERSVRFAGFQAIRIGLCTEDLAMLAALHMGAGQSNGPAAA